MIHKDMTIEEIFETHPDKAQRLAHELGRFGLECVGCQAATYETLEMGVLGHGMDLEALERLITVLNGVLEEKSDPDTIVMTEKAAKRYLEILESEGKSGWGLRLGDKAGGCSGFEYVLDYSEKADENDVIFQSSGVEIHVDKRLLDRMIGSMIDYADDLNGGGFKIINPNVKNSCGCGKSQSY